MKNKSLAEFFSDIKDKVLLSFNENNFDELQLNLLEQTFDIYQNKSETDLFTTSISIFYLITKSFNKNLDEKSILLGAFCTLYIVSLDLFDDIQDNDLVGKPHEKVGVPIAVNNAITLLFLSLDFLRQVITIEENIDKKILYLKVFNQASLLAVKGQHKDLIGIDSTKTPQDVINMQKEKSSSFSLIAVCAAIYSDCDNETIQKIKNIAEEMVIIFQIVDDIKDIYGKKISPDLLTNKVTYPISCFLEMANNEELDKLNNLKAQLPDSLKGIRELIYSIGAIKKSAETIEVFRVNVHNNISQLNLNTPSMRAVLYLIDYLSNSIYKVKEIEETSSIIHPNRDYDLFIKNLVNTFFINMVEFKPPEQPSLIPWHLPQWMYESKRNIIYYSDLEGFKEDILPIQSKVLGMEDLDKLEKVLIDESTFVMAHEIFHYWRNQSGRITKDSWYEEWVANNLAIAYLREFFPNILNDTKNLLEELIIRKYQKLNIKAENILNKIFSNDYSPSLNSLGYQVDIDDISAIQFHMTFRIIFTQHKSLKELVETFL
ncbi:MAG: polyprenyl synthetase family protein [Candidatus Sericytochromatia bacterium]